MAAERVAPVRETSSTKLLATIAAAKFPTCRYAVRLNPNGERNYAVGDSLYPDIVAIKKATGEIAAMAAVETEESVGEGAAARWRDYAALGYPFYLFVPALAYTAARDLALRQGIAVRQVFVYRCADEKIMLV